MRNWKSSIGKCVHVKNIMKAWSCLKHNDVGIDLSGTIDSYKSGYDEFGRLHSYVTFKNVSITTWDSKKLQRADVYNGHEFDVTNKSFTIN